MHRHDLYRPMFYCVANCYHYDSKPTFMTNLDKLSAPIRGIIGGRDVSVKTHSRQPAWSVEKRIVTLVVLILLSPIALVCTTALIIKYYSPKAIEEGNKISELQHNNDLVIIKAAKHRDNGEYDKSYKVCLENPNIQPLQLNIRPEIVSLRKQDTT